MKNPIVYGKNAVRTALLRLRYSKRLKMGWIQSFERIRLKIEREGVLEMGSFNQNREKLYIGVMSGGRLKIGSHCFFNINASITCKARIEIGNHCKFGNNLVIVDHDHNYRACGSYSSENPEFLASPIRIGNNVWVGANVTILRGTVIGDGCVIGAGAVVKGEIPPKSKVIRDRVVPM